MEGRFTGRDIIERPSCPFCGTAIKKPGDTDNRIPAEMPLGACSCGAVYACDVTGHNLGAAMIEALVAACDGDYDLAFDLLPEKDYLEKEVVHYDLETHLIIHGGIYEGRRINGVLYFVRPQHEILGYAGEEGSRPPEKTIPIQMAPSSIKRGNKTFTRKEIEKMVKDYQMDSLLDLAERDSRIIRDLQRLLYSVDPLIRFRAAEAMGRSFTLIARRDPGMISRRLHGLFTALCDTAASSWGYIGAIGEIIRHNPGLFTGYIPQLYGLTADKELLPEVLAALGQIALERPEDIGRYAMDFIPMLRDRNPEVRGQAALLLGRLMAQEARDDLSGLVDDGASIHLYRNGSMESRTVGELAQEALRNMGPEDN